MIQVPASDVFDAIQLVKSLAELQPGETLDHKWGFVRREGFDEASAAAPKRAEKHRPKSPYEAFGMAIEMHVPGYRIANPGQSKAEGLWRQANPIAVADEIYDNYLMRKEGHLGD